MSIRNRYAIRKRRKGRDMRQWPALVGDGSGTIEVPGAPNLWYVRPIGSELPVPVYRGAAPRLEGYPVWVGQDVYNRRWVRILGTNLEALGAGGGSSTATDVEPHALSHFITGSDPNYITARQVVDTLCYATSGMTVHVNGGWVLMDGQPVYISPIDVDMTSSIPTGAAYSLIRANSSGTISVQDGTPAASFADLNAPDAPAVESGYVALALVRLYESMTALSRITTNPDVIPLHLAQVSTTIADHDHSGDAGDGGQFPVTNLTSEVGTASAPDGYVLTADGSDGTAWESLYNDGEGNPADVDETAAADGTSAYTARRDHRHKLGTVNLNDLDDVNTSGTGTGDIIYNNAGTWEDYPLGIGSKITIDGNDLRFGNVSGGNYINIDAMTGNLRLQGDATQWDDLRLSGSAARVGVTAPSVDAFGPSGSLRTLRFEEGHHDEIYFEIQMPHAWREGSNIYPHVHWSPVTTEAGNVVWQLDYTWANINDAFPAPTTMTTDATAAGGTAWVHKLSQFKDGSSNEYIDGAGKLLSSMLVLRLHRDAGAGSDTLTEDVAFLEFDIHYEIDSFGSDEEYIKDTTAALLLETGDYLFLESGDNLLLE